MRFPGQVPIERGGDSGSQEKNEDDDYGDQQPTMLGSE